MRTGSIVLLVSGLMAISTFSWGQKVEAGLMVGTSYYLGDLNPTTHFLNPEPAYGGFARYNFNPHISGRFSFLYMQAGGTDETSPYDITPPDLYIFQSTIMEAALQLEVNFLPFEAGNPKTRYSPYIFGGIGGFNFTPEEDDVNIIVWDPAELAIVNDPDQDLYKNYSYSYVFGIGLKYHINRYLTGGIEWGMRYTGTDYIDQVSMKGNPKNNDWYSFAGLSVSIRFKDRSRAICPY